MLYAKTRKSQEIRAARTKICHELTDLKLSNYIKNCSALFSVANFTANFITK